MVGSGNSDLSGAGSIPVISSGRRHKPDCPTLRLFCDFGAASRQKFENRAIERYVICLRFGSILSHFCGSFLLRMQRAEEALTRNL